jgi:hypothetical protein
LLSSTAAHASDNQPNGPLRDGAIDNIMMSGVSDFSGLIINAESQSTGLTPYMMSDPRIDPRLDERAQTTSSSTSRRASEEASGQSSSGPSILSPNNIFNFSPGPMADQLDPVRLNNIWAAANDTVGPNSTFGLQPSTRTEGPWRGVETVENIFAGSGNKFDKDGIPLEQPPMYNSMPVPQNSDGMDINIDNVPGDGFVMDEVLQQKILMDLFWPGWPPNLPEPNIVNDL